MTFLTLQIAHLIISFCLFIIVLKKTNNSIKKKPSILLGRFFFISFKIKFKPYTPSSGFHLSHFFCTYCIP